jgi:hypothetical protein
MINLINKKCSAQKLLLGISYFLSYCPLLIFIFHISPKLYCSQGDTSDCRVLVIIMSPRTWCQQVPVVQLYTYIQCSVLLFKYHNCGSCSEVICDGNVSLLAAISLDKITKTRRWILTKIKRKDSYVAQYKKLYTFCKWFQFDANICRSQELK